MAKKDKDNKWPLNTWPIGCLKAVVIATMTTGIMVPAGTMPMVNLAYAWNSMGANIMVEAKPKCVKILVRHTMEAANRVMPNLG